ncbi:hypothetical protein [Shewanella carassii]|uniref:ABC transporter permease n=1 Tax=Shewanella carassii TaxID=1987584 RepID=A0ABQ1TEC0_9GAMM|nr:hypothetical protein [Shewanella carassii]GGE89765.1 ABC transporter permease [Shewanella carassii]
MRLAFFPALWLKDIGSVSFLITAGLGLFLALVIQLSGDSDKTGMLQAMAILSGCAAFAWQSNRLAACEWLVLVPGFKKALLLQATVLAILVQLICLAISPANLAIQGVAWSLGLAFVLACLRYPKCFYWSVLLFLVLPISESIARLLPAWSWWLATTVLLVMLARQLRLLCWHPQARSIYLNGLEAGWVLGPRLGIWQPLLRLEAWLHPVNFFIGPTLSWLLILLPGSSLLLILVNLGWHKQLPVIYIAGQLAMLICFLVHWSRLQRWRGAELLLLLPGHTGLAGLTAAFARGQTRLLALLGLMLTLILMLDWFVGETQGLAGVHQLLAALWGSALLLALGSISHQKGYLAGVMLLFIVNSTWSSGLARGLQQGSGSVVWLSLDLIMLVLALVVFHRCSRRLWRTGVVEP